MKMKSLIIPFLIFIFAGVFAFAQSGVYYMNLGNDAEKKNRYSEAAGYFKQAAESFRQEGR